MQTWLSQLLVGFLRITIRTANTVRLPVEIGKVRFEPQLFIAMNVSHQREENLVKVVTYCQ